MVTYSAHVLDHVTRYSLSTLEEVKAVSPWVVGVPDSEVTGVGDVIAWGPSPVHVDYVIGVYPRKTH